MSTFDLRVRVLSCDSCGAPLEVPEAGGVVSCSYCASQLVIERRRLEPARLAHTLTDEDARFAKLRLQTGRDLHDNPYSTVGPPPGCEALTRSGLEPVQAQLAQRFREALALVRADPSFEHQRLLWWCATMLNQGYGLADKQLERRAVLERAIEALGDPGFRHMLYVNLAGAAASGGELEAARAWIERCDPRPEDIMLDSGYRVGLASILVREGDDAQTQTLALVGARVGDVPEAHQYRLMFAMYRIHAHEALGHDDEALGAADAIASDPEIGQVLVEALAKNQLAPATAAKLAGVQAAPVPTPVPTLTQLAAPTAVSPSSSAGGISTGKLALLIVVLVLGAIAVVFVAVLFPVLRDLGLL